jgi:hypothetical protein
MSAWRARNVLSSRSDRSLFQSIPEIHKLHGHGEFMRAHGGDDRL